MIKLKLHSIDSKNGVSELEITDGEFLSKGIERILVSIPLGKKLPQEIFNVVVNGHIIPFEMWENIKLKSSDNVLILPRIEGGEQGGSLIRSFIIIAATMIAAAYFPPAAGIGNALLVAGSNILATLAAYALIPPPVLENSNLSTSDSNISGSQMYSLSGQSNQVKRFGSVPKVYGFHKMFPTLAANPYIQIEADPATGELVQYLYAIYDFGLGPCYVGDVKIGETGIENFSDVKMYYVDLHNPASYEGPWDAQNNIYFSLYKKDVDTVSVGILLDANRVDGGVSSGYQAIRTCSDNPNNYAQSIILNFVNPAGLYAYSSTGQIVKREIELEIKFRLVGSSTWLSANDFNYVSDYSQSGGFDSYDSAYVEINHTAMNSLLYSLYQLEYVPNYTMLETNFAESGAYPNYTYGYKFWATKTTYGLSAGVSYILIVRDNAELIVGRPIRANNLPSIGSTPSSISYSTEVIGTIASITPAAGYPGFSQINLTAPVSKNIVLFTKYTGPFYPQGSSIPINIERNDFTSSLYKVWLSKDVQGKGKISRATTDQSFTTFSFTPRQVGQFEIKVDRVQTVSAYTNQVQDSLSWTSISSRFEAPAIVTDKRHKFLEIKIRATGQLNGVIQNLSGMVYSALPVYDGGVWTRQLTNNPAWVFADILTGAVNKKAVSNTRLDLTSLVEWANYCDAIPTAPSNHNYLRSRFETNFILDFETTVQQLLAQVSAAANASLNMVDGKYGVLLDIDRVTPVQIFTPRNSRDFSSTRIYSKKPHALQIKYVDAGNDYVVSEETVYDDGYTEANATEFDELTSFACTNSEQAWRFGRYILAQNRLRQEVMTINVDFEYLVCTRGDYVQITQDIMKVGGTPSRVRTIVGNRITIDEGMDTGPLSYGYIFRSASGTIYQGTVAVVTSDTFDLTGTLPAIGDLIVIGEVGLITYDCIVKSITPNEDLTAGLTLVEKNSAIYNSESLSTFPVYDPQINNTTDAEFDAPGEVQNLEIDSNSWRCTGVGYEYYIKVDWDPPVGSAYEIFYVYANKGTGYNLITQTKESFYEYLVDENYLGAEHTFKVIAVSSSGKKLELGLVASVAATPLSKTTRPSDVLNFNTDITGEVLQLSWDRVTDCDVEEYLIRYSPSTTGVTWATTIPLVRIDRNTSLSSTQARTGTYLIKAVDFNGNESLNATVAITSIPNLFNLNVVETINDFPTLLGVFTKTAPSGASIMLDVSNPGAPDALEYYSEGFYYYKDLLDLGDIYTVRLQSLIQAEGYTEGDIMANWATLSSVLFMSNAKTSEWDVEAQYRATEQLNLMSTWTTLSSVNPLSGGVEETFTPWRKFIMSDATGRIFQFRLKLTSTKTSVTPRVIAGTIQVDMPDRIESYNNLQSASGSYTLSYAPAFYGPTTSPSVQISLQNGQAGDYWTFTSNTLTGFTINFFNSSNVAVDRTFDVQVKGWGRKALNVI